MHQTNVPYLYQNNILGYLDCFAKDLLAENNYNMYKISILVVGGSALALKYNFRGTVDIDADISFGGTVSRSIKRVSKQCGIPSDWLNQDFVKSYSYSRRIWDDAVFLTMLQGYLGVYVVSDVTQLCMKLVSGRKKDYADISALVDRCFAVGMTEEHVMQRFNYLYADYIRYKPGAVKAMTQRFKYLRKVNHR